MPTDAAPSRSREAAFSRTAMLIGRDSMARLGRTRAIIFGLGGVGSWCAEALVRTGIGHLEMIDPDTVAPSNLNRQLPATTQTLGLAKVEVLKSRFLAINPQTDIVARQEKYCQATASSWDFGQYDYVIDAIDSLPDKALLITEACRAGTRLFSSMGAALKSDPSRVAVAEFWKVKGCPLARALRQRFKKSGVFPARKFSCVYSDELLKNQPDIPHDPDSRSPRSLSATSPHR